MAALALGLIGIDSCGLPLAAEPAKPTNVDPHVAELLNSHDCHAVHVVAAASAEPSAEPLPRPDDAAVLASLNARLHAQVAELAVLPGDTGGDPTPSASPTAAASTPPDASASTSPAPSDTTAATASPSPSPSPTPVPVPPVPPAGPQELVPPTPRPIGTPTASPVPLPTTTPLASASGPVFLVRPSGPPTINDRAPQPSGSLGSPSPAGSTLPSTGTSPQGGATAPSTTESPTPAPSPLATLGPDQVVTIADRIAGSSDRTQPSDLYGNVHIFYSEGQVVGDRAHFDGDHTILVSGHTYLVNRNEDSILYADQIAFDTQTRKATLLNGVGETIEGVQHGKLHYVAQQLTARSNGISHGDRASFSTCENPHAGYHVEARSIDVTPGSKIVARKVVIFLGPTAIFYLPLLVIPLVEAVDQRRQASFLPLIGYDQIEGFFIKARIGFGPSETYYGYYRVEYFTKRGLGLGYSAYIGSAVGKRFATVDAYTISDHLQNARLTNVNAAETENFSRTVRGQFSANYVSDYGPTLALPATLNVTGSIAHTGVASTENLTFSRFLQGALSDNLNLAFIDSITLSPALQQQFNFDYSKFNSPLSSSNTFKIQSNTRLFTHFADYNLAYEKTDYSSNPFGYDSVPELQILPHLNYGGAKFTPQVQLTIGNYTEPQNHFTTSRAQAQIDESVFYKILGGSDFSAHYNLVQDYYGTGDAKAFDQQNASLSTPIGDHVVNSINYNEQHPIGPANVPFQLFDRLSSGSHAAQETLRFFNQNFYSFQVATGTSFNRLAQALNYQFNVSPSPKSYLVLGGFYQPGPGLGFDQTNVQAITPFGKDTTLEFTTNVDWKNHNRLTSKNIYISRTVDECYNIEGSYNQDLKQFSFNIVILAFPGQGAGFGFGGGGQSSPIIPQNFAL